MSIAGSPPPTPSSTPASTPASIPASPSRPPPQRRGYIPPSLRNKVSDTTISDTGGYPHKDENEVTPQENTSYPEKGELKTSPKKPTLFLVVPDASVKASPAVWKMINSALTGLMKGKKPNPTSEGSGGSYYLYDESGIEVGIFKPTDEEPSAVNNPRRLQVVELKKGTKVGKGAMRELATCLVDHPKSGPQGGKKIEVGFSGVPLTTMVRCIDDTFNHPNGFEGGNESRKVGSLQMFMQNCESCEDIGSGVIDSFPVEEVHKIAVLDLRIGNVDRHGGNILRKSEEGRVTLIPIDHGYTFPHSFEDTTLEWLNWPQAKIPFSKETLDYIELLDTKKDLAVLKSYGLELLDESIRTLRILTSLLKDGAVRGLSPFDIGHLLCRETYNEESVIEKILAKAHELTPPVADDPEETEFRKTVSDLLCAELDKV